MEVGEDPGRAERHRRRARDHGRARDIRSLREGALKHVEGARVLVHTREVDDGRLQPKRSGPLQGGVEGT